jgi:glycosyltransferase involved in cell wall biosynthesis
MRPVLPRIAYAPYHSSLRAPGDRRRFVAYARSRKLTFELARPGERYDLVVITELADITYWATYSAGKVVYDLIDSYLAAENTTFNDRFRGLYKFATGAHRRLVLDYRESVKNMCRRAAAVVCTTREQKLEISKYSDNAYVILDAHNTVATVRKTHFDRGRVFKIVWEGLPSNVRQLRVVQGALQELSSRESIELHIVTDPVIPRLWGHIGKVKTTDVARQIFQHTVCHPWGESSCAHMICECDLAIIPIELSDPFVRGKPENKLLLLWKMGMPVVASGTPAYHRAMTAAGLEHVCQTDSEWIATIAKLMADPELRRTAAMKGHSYASHHFSEQQIFSLWDSMFASCGFAFGPPLESAAEPNEDGWS